MSLSTTLTNKFCESGISNIIIRYKREIEEYEYDQNLKKLFFLELMIIFIFFYFSFVSYGNR